MAVEPTKRGPGSQYEPRSPASGYPNTPTSLEAKQTLLSAKKRAGAGVKKLVEELRTAHPKVGDKELRDTLHRAVKTALPLRRGRKEDPRISRGVELYLAGTPMPEVLRDPGVLGPRPPGRPTDPQVWQWDKAAASVRKAIYRQASKRRRTARRRARQSDLTTTKIS